MSDELLKDEIMKHLAARNIQLEQNLSEYQELIDRFEGGKDSPVALERTAQHRLAAFQRRIQECRFLLGTKTVALTTNILDAIKSGDENSESYADGRKDAVEEIIELLRIAVETNEQVLPNAPHPPNEILH